MNEYADFLKGAGFDVKATNMSDWFIQILDMELARLEVQKAHLAFLNQFFFRKSRKTTSKRTRKKTTATSVKAGKSSSFAAETALSSGLFSSVQNRVTDAVTDPVTCCY